jgi:two-component system sensor histidine kinase QseC
MLNRLGRGMQASLFRRLMLGFSCVIIAVALLGLLWVFLEAKATQTTRTSSENRAHVRALLMHMRDIAAQQAHPQQHMRDTLEQSEAARVQMFKELDYHSRVRLRVWQYGRLIYNSQPDLPDVLPAKAEGGHYAWVRWSERDDGTGVVVERSHEVDDEWMLTLWGVNFLLSSTIFSLPLLLVPAWLIVRIGLKPLRTIAAAIEQRSDADLSPLPDSRYRELSPLVAAINALMARLKQRIEHEHEFLADAAHELKTPLAAIQINSHVLLSRVSGETAARCAEPAAGVREGVARTTHTVHQLLAFERVRAGPEGAALPVIELGAFVRDRLAMAVPLALHRNIEIEFSAPPACHLPLHVESLGAMLDNLIGNAVKYSPDDGRIAIRLEDGEGGAGPRLTITDQGPGIAPALRQKVFERFYRILGQEQSGSGLGLAIAERAAERNGATITLADGVGGAGLSVIIDFTIG